LGLLDGLDPFNAGQLASSKPWILDAVVYSGS